MVHNNIYAHTDNPCHGCISMACATCPCNTGCSAERDELMKLRVPFSKEATQPRRKVSHIPSASKGPKTISISTEVFGDVGKAIVCTADSDGMNGAGICTGDYVIFDTSLAPRSGDVVMAKVDGQMCCRRYFLEGDKGRFRREDGITQDVVTADFTVLGVMVGLMRKVERAG